MQDHHPTSNDVGASLSSLSEWDVRSNLALRVQFRVDVRIIMKGNTGGWARSIFGYVNRDLDYSRTYDINIDQAQLMYPSEMESSSNWTVTTSNMLPGVVWCLFI